MLPTSGMYPGKEAVIKYLMLTNDILHAVRFKVGKKPTEEILLNYLHGSCTFEEGCDVLQETFGTTWAMDTLRNIMTVTPPIDDTHGRDVNHHELQRKNIHPWVHSEDMRLLAGILHHGIENWNMISSNFVVTKTRAQCNQRWFRTLDPSISKDPWTQNEDKELIRIVHIVGEKSWAEIGRQLGNRSDIQCRYRYQLLKKETPNLPELGKIVKRQHTVYQERDICPILDHLSSGGLKRGDISQISRETGIPHQTLADWAKIRTSPGKNEWFPQSEGHPMKRSLPQEIENSISQHLSSNIIEPGLGTTREDV